MPVPVKRPFKSAAKGRATRTALLNAAERLFAEKGIDATGVRDIAARARANLAAVHYHFGSKLALVRAVFERRLTPLNRERLRLLDQAEAQAGPAGPTLEQILHAFLAPSVTFLRDNPRFTLLAARIHSEPDQKLFKTFFDQLQVVIVRFQSALVRALPQLPLVELVWRMHFVVGAMINTWCGSQFIEKIAGKNSGLNDVDAITRRLIEFCSAGLTAERKEA